MPESITTEPAVIPVCETCGDTADVKLETHGETTFACDEHEMQVRLRALRGSPTPSDPPRKRTWDTQYHGVQSAMMTDEQWATHYNNPNARAKETPSSRNTELIRQRALETCLTAIRSRASYLEATGHSVADVMGVRNVALWLEREAERGTLFPATQKGGADHGR